MPWLCLLKSSKVDVGIAWLGYSLETEDHERWSPGLGTLDTEHSFAPDSLISTCPRRMVWAVLP